MSMMMRRSLESEATMTTMMLHRRDRPDRRHRRRRRRRIHPRHCHRPPGRRPLMCHSRLMDPSCLSQRFPVATWQTQVSHLQCTACSSRRALAASGSQRDSEGPTILLVDTRHHVGSTRSLMQQAASELCRWKQTRQRRGGRWSDASCGGASWRRSTFGSAHIGQRPSLWKDAPSLIICWPSRSTHRPAMC